MLHCAGAANDRESTSKMEQPLRLFQHRVDNLKTFATAVCSKLQPLFLKSDLAEVSASAAAQSAHVQENRTDLLKADLAQGLRTISLISVFSSALLIVLAYPVSRIFIGEYVGTVALANVLIALMIGLLPFSFVFMMQRAFYALEDTRTPFIFTVIQIALHIAGSITMSIFVEREWLVVSLSLVTSFTVTVQATVAYLFLRRRIGSLKEHRIASSTTKFALVAVLAGLAGWGTTLNPLAGHGRSDQPRMPSLAIRVL